MSVAIGFFAAVVAIAFVVYRISRDEPSKGGTIFDDSDTDNG